MMDLTWWALNDRGEDDRNPSLEHCWHCQRRIDRGPGAEPFSYGQHGLMRHVRCDVWDALGPDSPGTLARFLHDVELMHRWDQTEEDVEYATAEYREDLTRYWMATAPDRREDCVNELRQLVEQGEAAVDADDV